MKNVLSGSTKWIWFEFAKMNLVFGWSEFCGLQILKFMLERPSHLHKRFSAIQSHLNKHFSLKDLINSSVFHENGLIYTSVFQHYNLMFTSVFQQYNLI